MTPQQIEAMKMALNLATMHHTDDGYAALRAKVRSASKEALAQPEQEPVAWVNRSNLNSAAIERNRGGQGDTHTWSETPTWDHSVPLYTTPPQRKPLTDAEIENALPGYRLVDAIYIARAIEAAHGIKE